MNVLPMKTLALATMVFAAFAPGPTFAQSKADVLFKVCRQKLYPLRCSEYPQPGRGKYWLCPKGFYLEVSQCVANGGKT